MLSTAPTTNFRATSSSATLRATSTSAAIHTTYVGSFGWGTWGGASTSFPLNGLIGPVWLLPYDATQTQLAALAGLTSAPPALPYVRVTGDLVRNLPTSMLGEVEGSDPVAVTVGGAMQEYERVRFGLEEAP